MSDCPKCDDNPHPKRPEPKVTCKHDKPPCEDEAASCEFKTLGTHWELRKEEGECPLIRVLGEDGQPCWYRAREVAEGETGPEEDSPDIIYDCLGRYWKLQAGKDAAAVEALEAAVAALTPKQALIDLINALSDPDCAELRDQLCLLVAAKSSGVTNVVK